MMPRLLKGNTANAWHGTAIPSAAGVRHTQLGEIVIMQRKMVLQAETCTNRIPYKVPEEPS